jgi:3-hydroxybutyryl-CoA dehydrogenase
MMDSKDFFKREAAMKKIQHVAVIGAGLMGLGIGVEYARFGYDVKLFNTGKTGSEAAQQRAKEILDLMVKTRLMTRAGANAAAKRLTYYTDIKETARGADLVVESVLENLPLKQALFAELDAICPPPVLLCTNTSSLRVTEIAARAKHPERILVTHYTQPPHFAPLVEVAAGEKTDPAIVPGVVEMLRKMHKMVVVCKDTTRFLQNRIQRAIGQECQAMVDEGLATPEMIDNVICYGFGRRMGYTGYFKRLDLIGLDFASGLDKAKGLQPWPPIAEHVAKGETGMASGKGFYEWPETKREQFLLWYHTELIRLMQQDIKRGDI